MEIFYLSKLWDGLRTAIEDKLMRAYLVSDSERLLSDLFNLNQSIGEPVYSTCLSIARLTLMPY